MMNPLQLVQMMRSNPQQMMQAVMNSNPQFQNNPMIQNAIQMAQNQDSNGLEQLARNLCKEKNIDVDQAIRQIQGQFKL